MRLASKRTESVGEVNFRYRWRINGNEYVGSKEFSSHEELLQHIAKLGGELIDILEPSSSSGSEQYFGEDGGNAVDSAIAINATTPAVGVLQEYEYINQLHGKWHEKWEIKSRRVYHLQGRHFEEFEIFLQNGLSERLCFDITSFFGKSDWALVLEWDGGTTYVDKAGIRQVGTSIFALVRYCVNTPGTDKLSNKQFKEMWSLEEYDLTEIKFRSRNMTLLYIDDSIGQPLEMIPEWQPVGKGNDITFKYLLDWKRTGGQPERNDKPRWAPGK